jgi:hypothetical protein
VGRRILRPAPEGKGKYVYCVMISPGERMSFGRAGFDGEEVYTLEYRDLAAVVSDAVFREYAVNEEEVETHRKVVEGVMKSHSVLPVAYGMVFKTKKLLLIAMSAGYAAMKKAFEAVDRKVELGIKVFVPRELEGWDGRQCRSDFLESLKGIASDWKDLKLFSDRLVMNSAFLVEGSRVDEFTGRVGELVSKYGEVKVQYSGPWPAYNFVDIHILGRQRKGFR